MAKLRDRPQSSIVVDSNKLEHNNNNSNKKKKIKKPKTKTKKASSTKRKLPTAKRTGQSVALVRRTITNNNFNDHNHQFNLDESKRILPKYSVSARFHNNIDKNWVRRCLNRNNKTYAINNNKNDKSNNRQKRSRKKSKNPMVIKQLVNRKLVKIQINFEDFVHEKLTTIIGHVDLMRISQLNEKFSRLLINSLNFHVDNIVDKVSIKRRSKLKKTRSAKLEELRNNRIDFNSPESILGTLNLSSILNKESFELLPSYFQFKLTKFLPKKDQEVLKNNVICPKETAFNNEFFNKALVSFSTRLKDGKLTKPALRKLKLVQEKRQRRFDKVKIKYFEPFFKTPKEERLKKPTQEDNYREGKQFIQTFLLMNDKVDKVIHKTSSKVVAEQPPTTAKKIPLEMDNNMDSDDEQPEFPYTADMIDKLFTQEMLNSDQGNSSQPVNDQSIMIGCDDDNNILFDQSSPNNYGDIIEQPFISQYVQDVDTPYFDNPDLIEAETYLNPLPAIEKPSPPSDLGQNPKMNVNGDEFVEPTVNAAAATATATATACENPICKPIVVSIINDTPVIIDNIPTENSIHSFYSQFNSKCETTTIYPSTGFKEGKVSNNKKEQSLSLPHANVEPIMFQNMKPKRRYTRQKDKPKKDNLKFKPIMTKQESTSLFERLTGCPYQEPTQEKVNVDKIVPVEKPPNKLTTTIEMVIDGQANGPANGPTDNELPQNRRPLRKQELRKFNNSIMIKYDSPNNGKTSPSNPILTASPNQSKLVEEIQINGQKFFKLTNSKENFKITLKMANSSDQKQTADGNQNEITKNGH